MLQFTENRQRTIGLSVTGNPRTTLKSVGPVGPQGVQGETGATGSTGPQGSAATIAVGSVTTVSPGSSATVTNSGTSGAAIFDFEIPRGATGAAGVINGDTGGADNAALRADGTGGSTVQSSPLIIADTTGALSRSGGGGIPVQATNTNSTTAAGDVGEPTSSTIASGSAVSLTSTVAANITTRSLAAGNWLVFGIGYSNPSLGNATQNQCSISTTSATHQSFSSGGLGNAVNATAGTNVMPTGVTTLSLASTTTVYLVFSSTFPSGTNAAHGTLAAIRLP